MVAASTTSSAADRALDQDRAAADDDDRQRVRREPRTLDAGFQHVGDARLRARDQILVEMRRPLSGSPSSTRPAATTMSVVVSVCAAEHQRLGHQFVADRTRPDGQRPSGPSTHERAAAEAEREHVGHAEVGAHAADFDRHRRLARKALVQRADVGRRAADVDDDRLRHAGEERGAADRVGRPAREGQHRESARHRRASISVPSFWVRRTAP